MVTPISVVTQALRMLKGFLNFGDVLRFPGIDLATRPIPG